MSWSDLKCARGDTGGMIQSAMGIFKMVTGADESKEVDEYTKATKTSPADMILWSGCKDSQTRLGNEYQSKLWGSQTSSSNGQSSFTKVEEHNVLLRLPVNSTFLHE
ncbi:hypothetical protein BDZ89DRAFT_1050432 [Hymenopellis radicata]|nr:hypothetical protein BDZ89DRAFT_1050432 [Hymenopellis radicata]